MKHQNFVGIGVVLIVIAGSFAWEYKRAHRPQSVIKTSEVAKAPFNMSAYSISEADSLWVIINKQRQLEDGFVPPDLVEPSVTTTNDSPLQVRATSRKDVEALFKASAAAGHKLVLEAAYHSQADQQALYEASVAMIGQSAADLLVPKARYSEDQTGLAIDVGTLDKQCDQLVCFADTATGKWLALHAHEYGFIIRFGKDQQQSTGYGYQPWHLRYVGKALAGELYKTKQTMEQFFGLSPKTTYSYPVWPMSLRTDI